MYATSPLFPERWFPKGETHDPQVAIQVHMALTYKIQIRTLNTPSNHFQD